MFRSIDEYEEYVKINKCKLTVFVTSSNREYYLSKMLRSIFDQSINNYPVVVLDNMSTDNTKNMIISYDKNNLFFKERESIFGFNNYAFAFTICKTEFMIVLHDDDIIEYNYIETMLDYAEKQNDFAAICCEISLIDSNDNFIKRTRSIPSYDVTEYANGEYLRKFLSRDSKDGYIVYPTVLYRVNFYRDIKRFQNNNAGPAADQLIWFQTERYGGKILKINKQLYRYRVHTNQDSSINSGIMEKQLIDFLAFDDYYYNNEFFSDKNVSIFLKCTLKCLLLNYSKNRHNRKRIKSYLIIDEKFKRLGKRCKKMAFYYAFSKKVTLFSSKIMSILDRIRRLIR